MIKRFFQKDSPKSDKKHHPKKHKHFWMIFYDTYDKRYKLICRRARCRKIRELRKMDMQEIKSMEMIRKYDQEN